MLAFGFYFVFFYLYLLFFFSISLLLNELITDKFFLHVHLYLETVQFYDISL